MIKEIQYTNIRRIMDELNKHPLLSDITLEQVVSYLVTFINIFGIPKLYQDKETIVKIEQYRGLLPCDLISINQVMDCKTKLCLRSSTNTFTNCDSKYTFRVQGRAIITSLQEGEILVSYKSIPIDEDGFPLLIDNSVFIEALKEYIKKEYFSILFDLGKLNQAVLQHTEQRYAWLAGQLRSEFTIPSVSEMESIKNMWTRPIQNNNEFYTGFKNLGNQEPLKVH